MSSVPATRVRLNAIVAQTAQAEFAQKCPALSPVVLLIMLLNWAYVSWTVSLTRLAEGQISTVR